VWALVENSWPYMNNSAGSNFLYIAVAFDPTRGGLGPSLIRYNKVSGETVNLGPMFASNDVRSFDGMEGWHFSTTQPTTLYIPRSGVLQRFDGADGALRVARGALRHCVGSTRGRFRRRLACLPLTRGARQLLAQLGAFTLQRRPLARGRGTQLAAAG